LTESLQETLVPRDARSVARPGDVLMVTIARVVPREGVLRVSVVPGAGIPGLIESEEGKPSPEEGFFGAAKD